ncbi:hypothetical protein DAPPUDRAFT_103793 [Daphnia pulex]|uniref:Uncharacterized protein n=1 Tax=Daphnia pulex TaxID=6669 RepID=E9GKA8_DAPPU|nr:hypothetical protein DAPPUDRAFT_103793 [Daphnia pulex]|eukprot:EFX80089.1 hypothetical protein DAPPUDRAFT_103793 [Daphnia pulex]
MLSSVKLSASGSPFDLAELMYRFLLVLDRVSSRLSNREKEQLEEYYSNYITTLFRERTNTVLHVAITNFRASLRPVSLIVRLGAGVIATDENEQTTLYNLAASGRYFSEQSVSRFNMLLDGGDHLDAHGIRYDAVGVARLREFIARHSAAQVSENGRTMISVVKDGLRVCENNGQINDDH